MIKNFNDFQILSRFELDYILQCLDNNKIINRDYIIDLYSKAYISGIIDFLYFHDDIDKYFNSSETLDDKRQNFINKYK